MARVIVVEVVAFVGGAHGVLWIAYEWSGAVKECFPLDAYF